MASARQTLFRERAEGVGHVNVELDPEAWRRQHVYSWRNIVFDSGKRWFLVRVAHSQLDRTGMGEAEEVT